MKNQSNISPQQISLDRKQCAFTEIFIAWFIFLFMLTNITVSAQSMKKLDLKNRLPVQEIMN